MFRASRSGVENIFHYVGVVLIALGLCMLLPAALSAAAGEWSAVLDLLVSVGVTAGVGNLLYFNLHARRQVTWNQGLVIVALSWLLAMLFSALPLYLNGHYSSYLDACFEAMSGFATTGLTLTQDLDHLAYGMNFWRHFTMFLGGQGIVVLVITYFTAGSSTAAQMYTGEGRESIMPNVIESSRFIWRVSMVYLATGTLALGVCLLAEGMAPVRSFFQASCLFMAGFDTGGYAPQALNVGYYHSLPVELITVVFMFLGMINFAIQYEVWSRRPRELVKNMEMRVLATSLAVTLALLLAGIGLAGTFGSFGAGLRRGGYQLISAHSGTGFMTVCGRQLGERWGDLALLVLILAMGIGGCACATSGAIKVYRLGIIGKEMKRKMKQALSPASAVLVSRFHHIREVTMSQGMVGAALLTTALYLLLYLLGTLAGLLYGYGLSDSAFESVSAAGNVGLTTGITGHTMPALLKVVYILQMWAGRLEVMAVVVLIAYFLNMLRRDRR